MKSANLIRNLGPHLLEEHPLRPRHKIGNVLWVSLVLWVLLLGIFYGFGIFPVHSSPPDRDQLVLKIYPDGTRKLFWWSETKKSIDEGAGHGGTPVLFGHRSTPCDLVSHRPEMTGCQVLASKNLSAGSPSPAFMQGPGSMELAENPFVLSVPDLSPRMNFPGRTAISRDFGSNPSR
ncbi:MAG: hypothetical protein EBV19_09410 [Flavobacteriia bacterium]|nr:hypothetical protein [Flavobacteriia bacterium]